MRVTYVFCSALVYRKPQPDMMVREFCLAPLLDSHSQAIGLCGYCQQMKEKAA